MNCTFEVHGHKVRTRTQRRYVIVTVRPEPVRTDKDDVYVAFARVDKRTDNVVTAKDYARRWANSLGPGCLLVVVDTTTGKEVQ